MIYFNIKTIYGIETIDHLEKEDFNSYSEYKQEIKRLINEYYLCKMYVYTSSRSTKEYREKQN